MLLVAVGEDPNGYGEHSMKRGAATEAAKNGAEVGEIQVSGNWTNSRTASLYVDTDMHRNRLLRPYLG